MQLMSEVMVPARDIGRFGALLGEKALVAVTSVYGPGRRELTFFGTCGGYDIYGVGSCACSTAAQVAESDLADDLICPG